MKKTLKTLLLMAMVCMLVFSLVGCGGNQDTEEPNPSEEVAEFDFSAYPAELSDWTSSDFLTYMTARELINDAFLSLPLSEGDLTGLKAAGGFIYMDTDAASVVINVFEYDETNEESKAMLDSVIENQAIVIDGETVSAVDGVIGHFGLCYLNGTDDAYIASFLQAVNELSSFYGVEPAYMTEL
ncbi:MAG: hypothetical protein HUJ66_03425 [Oscillospiraceae bacterium]|nr:hypothetical protein [Oscillospiraceae bacterium]